jgi:hypothetical protein
MNLSTFLQRLRRVPDPLAATLPVQRVRRSTGLSQN